MGVLESVPQSFDRVSDSIKNPFSRQVSSGQFFGHDFPNGLLIEELTGPKESIRLTGNAMPIGPFQFGGSQRVVKEYYPGNSEPTVHIFGPQEDSISIRGVFKDKRFKNPSGKKDGSLYGLATELQQQVDAIRIRGNLIRMAMGEFVRYGFIESCNFGLFRLGRVEYEITFSIVGFNAPRECQFLQKSREVPFEINKKLINSLQSFQSSTIPSKVPTSISDELTDRISDVAEVINAVTDFVDTVISTAEDIGKSIARIRGLILNAQATISRFKRRVGSIGYNVTGDPVSSKYVNSELSSAPRTSQYIAAVTVANTLSNVNSLSSILQEMRKRFADIDETVPLSKHRVVSGDTLQKLASKFYSNSDEWKRIYDHNGLSSTELETGKILEVPRLD